MAIFCVDDVMYARKGRWQNTWIAIANVFLYSLNHREQFTLQTNLRLPIHDFDKVLYSSSHFSTTLIIIKSHN